MVHNLQYYINSFYSGKYDNARVLSQLCHDIAYVKDNKQIDAIYNNFKNKPDFSSLSKINNEYAINIACIVEDFCVTNNLLIPNWVNDPEFFSDGLYPNTILNLFNGYSKSEDVLAALREEAHPICLRHGYYSPKPIDCV